MPFLSVLPSESALLAALSRRPEAARALLDYHEALMRGPSEIPPGQREFLAAVVSAANACSYCAGVHEEAALAFGVKTGAVAGALGMEGATPPEPRLAALCDFVIKLARDPGRMTERDTQAVLAAGWSEDAVLDAVAICGLFSLMNRLVQGLGIEAAEAYRAMAGRRLRDGGYAALKSLLPTEATGRETSPPRPAGR